MIRVKLNEEEKAELMRQNPATRKDGGFQGLLVSLQENLEVNRGYIHLDQSTMERIHKYAFGYKRGGWQIRLKAIFGRTLGPDLRMAA
jgi:hypothetical protein